ncbi:MAG TPA: DUF2062 domain-containing protein [Bacteroidetes bacterium]|nr:DUF2062 domain-containing protein [Bacteroidota bacterium]
MKIRQLERVKRLLKQGTSARALALGTTLGILFGLFPVLGITTWLIPLIAWRLRLNVALMLALSYLVWPLQIVLIIPFLRLGEWIWAMPAFPFSVEKWMATFKIGFWQGIHQFWTANLCAAWGWLVIGVPAGVMAYLLLIRIFALIIKRKKVEKPTIP